MRTAIFGVLALAAMLASTIGFSAQDEMVDFARDVQPILRQQCVGCHGPTQQQNGFRLDQRRAAMRGSTVSPGIIRPGNSAASLFYLRISGNAAGPQMPPSGPLTAEQIAILRAWIDQGAEWPDALANDVIPPPLDPAATRLMDAALWGSAADVGRLLVRGVDPNVHNHAGATPLMWAVDDRAKSQLLVDYGADVNARSDDGRTPLMIAAGINGSAPVVRLLLDHGADMTVRAQSFWGRTTALAEAVLAGNLPVFDMLRKDGADLNAVGAWPAVLAVRGNCSGCAKVLLDALPQEQLAAAMYMIVPPLSDGLAIQSILARGGDANLRDLIGQTMLMRMAASDRMPVTVLNAMLAAGADVKARSKAGLTALAFAKARGETPVTRLLMTVGAIDAEPAPAGGEPERPVSPSPAASPRAAIERSLPLLQRTDVAFFKKSGCVSCHNNTLTAMSVAAARTHGIRVDDEIARQQLTAIAGFIDGWRDRALQGIGIPGDADTGGYILLGLAAEHYPPDAATDAMARLLKRQQFPDGHWRVLEHRPPLESNDIQVTATAMRGLQIYAPTRRRQEYQAAVTRAGAWLLQAAVTTNEERAFQILGLTWAGASRSAIQRAGHALLTEQRSDGGWAQLPSLASDAYATGQALYALKESGLVGAADPAYVRGVRFLLGTQYADGSWRVRTRALPIQPLFDIGFPHGADSWISAAGTNWATLALVATVTDQSRDGSAR